MIKGGNRDKLEEIKYVSEVFIWLLWLMGNIALTRQKSSTKYLLLDVNVVCELKIVQLEAHSLVVTYIREWNIYD